MAWFEEYLTWLTESELGMAGSQQENNHGTWYAAHVRALSLYLDKRQLAQKVVMKAMESLDKQLIDQGGQIHELGRTRSYFYSCFNLNALIHVAQVGDHLGLNLWNFESDHQKSLSLAIRFLTPVIDGKKWPYPTRSDSKLAYLIPILHRFTMRSNDAAFEKALEKAMSQLSDQDPIKSDPRFLELCLFEELEFSVN